MEARQNLIHLSCRNSGLTSRLLVAFHQALQAFPDPAHASFDEFRSHIDGRRVKLLRRGDLRNAASHESHA
jgi:hypothetical protein